MASFHAEQLAAASEIIAHFLGVVFRYALLLAPCQSGKTGTFHATARRALESGLVDRVILICGSPEKVLEQQAWDDAAEYSDEFLRDGRLDPDDRGCRVLRPDRPLRGGRRLTASA